MARITQAQRQANKEKYDAAIYQLFLDIGWDKLTYERVSKHLDVKKSTLQSYYPSKHDFFAIWEGKHMPMFFERANFNSRSEFLKSWQDMLNDDFLSVLIRYALSSSVAPPSEKTPVFKESAFTPIAEKLRSNMPEENIEEIVFIMLGMAVVHFAEQR